MHSVICHLKKESRLQKYMSGFFAILRSECLNNSRRNAFAYAMAIFNNYLHSRCISTPSYQGYEFCFARTCSKNTLSKHVFATTTRVLATKRLARPLKCIQSLQHILTYSPFLNLKNSFF